MADLIANGEVASSIRAKINAMKVQVDGKADLSNGIVPAHQLPSDTRTDSYLTFCGNANVNMLDAAFGKNNEDRITGIGRQLAMYAWFKGSNKQFHTLTELIQCNTFAEILSNNAPLYEAFGNPYIYDLIQVSPYASALFPLYTALITSGTLATLKQSTAMDTITTHTVMVDYIRNNLTLRGILATNLGSIVNGGDTTYTVPAGVNYLTLEAVGTGSSNAGKHMFKVIKVTPGEQIIAHTGRQDDPIPATKFGSYLEITEVGGYASTQTGSFLALAGNGAGGNSGVGTAYGGYGGGAGGVANGNATGSIAGGIAASATNGIILPVGTNSGGRGRPGEWAGTTIYGGNAPNGGGGAGNGCGYGGRVGNGGGGGYGGAGGSANTSGSATGEGGAGCIAIYS